MLFNQNQSQKSQRGVPVSDIVKIPINLEQFILGGKRYTEIVYEAPPPIREKCQEQLKDRHAKMKQAMTSDPESPGLAHFWKPDDQDLVDEREVFVARDMVCQI